MLTLLLGTDWTANRNEILSRIAHDVARRQGNRILMVPELISHDTERRLAAAAGATASRYAQVLSFTRLGRRVSDLVGRAFPPCLDDSGRIVARHRPHASFTADSKPMPPSKQSRNFFRR